MNQTLLIELLTEELPPKALSKLGAAFSSVIVNGLQTRGFLEDTSVATAYATPRRLACPSPMCAPCRRTNPSVKKCCR